MVANDLPGLRLKFSALIHTVFKDVAAKAAADLKEAGVETRLSGKSVQSDKLLAQLVGESRVNGPEELAMLQNEVEKTIKSLQSNNGSL